MFTANGHAELGKQILFVENMCHFKHVLLIKFNRVQMSSTF